MNPFATLGIPRSFEIDLRALEKSYRELSRAVHPDRHVDAGASAKREALARAIDINEAWRIVRDPIRRAEALLSLDGFDVSEGGQPRLGPEFLLAILEIREALADARRARDACAVSTLAEGIRARAAQAERELAAGLSAGPSERTVGKLGELRFYQRFLDEVSVAEDEIAA
jgi:molecular chaperone HscB